MQRVSLTHAFCRQQLNVYYIIQMGYIYIYRYTFGVDATLTNGMKRRMNKKKHTTTTTTCVWSVSANNANCQENDNHCSLSLSCSRAPTMVHDIKTFGMVFNHKSKEAHTRQHNAQSAQLKINGLLK